MLRGVEPDSHCVRCGGVGEGEGPTRCLGDGDDAAANPTPSGADAG